MENRGQYIVPRPAWNEEEVDETNVVRKAYKSITDRGTAINIRREALEKELRALNAEQDEITKAAQALLEVLN